VRAAGRSGKAAAHLRYIQRDGTSRDGERGQLYSAGEDRADGDAFLDRGKMIATSSASSSRPRTPPILLTSPATPAN
jgi:type IV secretory pathway VirD2 relaxase